MTPDPREVLSALLDREAVDADALALVLEEAAHRRLLIDFVRLRAALYEPAVDVPPVTSPPPARRRPWRTAAAALVLAGMSGTAGAWFAGTVVRGDDDPPEPTRVVRLEPVKETR